MQDYEKLNELEKIGEEEDETDFAEDGYERRGGGHSVIPLLQTAICVLALLALLFLKFTDEKNYGMVTNWYQKAASEEIELPKFESKATPAPTNSPAPTATPEAAVNGAAVQRI